jgi:Fe-S cluster assembly protein SufB
MRTLLDYIAKERKKQVFIKFRLKAFKKVETNVCPWWAYLKFPQIDLQDMIYYCSKTQKKLKDLSEVDPELLRTFEN